MNRKAIAIVCGVAALAIGWAVFRPELLFINERVSEGFPVAANVASVEMPMAKDAAVLAKGTFHGAAHETKGVATIYKLDDGKRVLRFTGFETSNGPDVRVLLTSADDANDDATVKSATRVEVAKLKGNVGDQNYELPNEIDLAKFKSVTIWCNRFNVNFGTAPLS